MVTLQDIADRAGVSRGTVDRVLHGRGKVSAEKAALIKKIADELGYEPIAAGSGLAIYRKMLHLAYIGPGDFKMAPFFKEVALGAKTCAKALKPYNVTVDFLYRGDMGSRGAEPIDPFTSGPESQDPETGQKTKLMTPFEILDKLKNTHYDGVAIDGLMLKSMKELEMVLVNRGIPFTVFNTPAAMGRALMQVSCNYRNAGKLACGLASFGRKGPVRVGIVSHDYGNIDSSTQRIEGFEEEMLNHEGMEIKFRLFMQSGHDRKWFYNQVVQKVREEKVDVVYLVNPGDYSSCEAIRKAAEKDGSAAPAIITNDLVSEQEKEMLRSGLINAAILQQPEVQGRLSLQTVFDYLAYGTRPKEENYYTDLSIVIGQNVPD